MKALVIRVGENPKVEEIKDDLKTMQELVGGYIECIGIDTKTVLVCNEEGKLRDLPINRPLIICDRICDYICGDFFICGTDEEDFTDLSDKMIKKWSEIYEG